jgi:hypothetical protein
LDKGYISSLEFADKKKEFLRLERERLRNYGDIFDIEAENWRRSQQQDADIDEYRRLASSGKIVNKDGEPVSGQMRVEIARDAERIMADLMHNRAVKPNTIQRLFGRVDGRLEKAEKIKREVAETPEYRALDFLEPGYVAGTPEYMLAMANAVREEQAKIDQWRADFIPSSRFGETVAKLKVGAADAHRIAGTAGEMSLASVDGRIAKYHREADAIVAAFEAAAKAPNPKKLKNTNHYRLLKQAKCIVPDGFGGEKYTISTKQSLSNLQADLKLPGSHWLNSVSGKNAMTAVASVAVPHRTHFSDRN